MADILADNQTESVLTLLDRGEADEATRNRVSAALLRAQTRMMNQLDDIRTNLWSRSDLEVLVDERHRRHCECCPAKKYLEDRGKPAETPKQHWLIALLSSESFRLFILAAILVWAVIYLSSGRDGVDAVKSGMQHLSTGGLK